MLKIHSSILLAPLEIIVGNNDSIVRDKAALALKKVQEQLEAKTVNKNIWRCARD
jgi:hypothetical protein